MYKFNKLQLLLFRKLVSNYLFIFLCSPFSEWSTKPLRRPAWRHILISCTIKSVGQVYLSRSLGPGPKGWISEEEKCKVLSCYSLCSRLEARYSWSGPCLIPIFIYHKVSISNSSIC